ncbi:hypothetical protein LOK49_LG06G00846 [Camellia lanceoleosa]|uniref:Uncharacterized protein n=1 Tax=Camellia lanceoleosa TaxID=1840588 RepID=A0ACC0H7F3_9ERIC|nr:hypothetical protein LOK49_LG06G00846 [Camellia lanceoleosa]
MGNGSRIHFWSAHWFRQQCLRLEFPRLYSLSTENEITLTVLIKRRRLSEDWNMNFRRSLFAWEAKKLARLVSLMSQVELGAAGSEDCWKWLACSSQQFSVASLLKVYVPSILMLLRSGAMIDGCRVVPKAAWGCFVLLSIDPKAVVCAGVSNPPLLPSFSLSRKTSFLSLYIYIQFAMANMSSFKALAVFFVVALFSAIASAQDSGMAPASSPGMDAGSAFSLPISAAVVCSSLALSLVALIKH